MKQFSIYWAEFLHEIRAGLRGPLFTITAIGFTLYVLMVLTNADITRGFGAIRNSAAVVYRFSTFMSMYMFFVWAWVFGQSVLRDRSMHLHENVLSSPTNLPTLLFSRYLGASVVAFLLGAVVPLSIFLLPINAWFGLVPSADVGAAPILPVLLSLVLFVLPTALGIGALFISSALWMRSVAGPFALAAFLMLIWMLSLIVFRNGDISDTIGSLIDPTVYNEVARQISDLTPNEKTNYLIHITPFYLMNRLVWVLLPIALLVLVLRRLKHEHLLMDKGKGKLKDSLSQESFQTKNIAKKVIVNKKTSWLKALFYEALWHLRLSLQNRGILVALSVLLIMSVGGSVINVLQNGQGPIIPHVEYLLSFFRGFSYLILVFIVAGFVGILMRRDQREGFNEMFDTTSEPLSIRVLGRILAAFLLTVALGLFPALTVWIIMGIGGMAISWWEPLIYQVVAVMPALLEICALAILSHSLIRNAGAAYGVSMMFGFAALMNAELGLLTYPPAHIGIPIGLSLSSLSSWEPWLLSLFSRDLLKIGVVFIIATLAWLSWIRGTDFSLTTRWRMAYARLGSVAPLALVGVLLITVPGTILYQKFIVHGEYKSLKDEIAEAAAWEKEWWNKGSAYSVEGGEIEIKVNPANRSFEATWKLDNVTSSNGLLLGSLPHSVNISSATVDGKKVTPDIAYDYFSLPLNNCPSKGCSVELNLSAKFQDWSADNVQSWLLPSGVWLRAENVLPTLGLDPQRRLHIPAEREEYDLTKLENNLPQDAMQAADTVAPKGSWHWNVEIGGEGVSSQSSGSLNAPLDFAMVWLPTTPNQMNKNGIEVWYGDTYEQAAKDILEDTQLMAEHVNSLLGQVPEVKYIVQAPRKMGEIVQYGQTLWLPENLGWDLASKGPGRERRRAAIASALSRHLLLQATDLHTEDGAEWLLSGVSGWIGMESLRRSDGEHAWMAEQNWQAKELSSALGKGLKAPIVSVKDAKKAQWLKPYTALSTLNWANAQGAEKTSALVKEMLIKVQNGESIPDALVALAGEGTAHHLLGMPMVSDISLGIDKQQKIQIKAKRWQWHDKGWELIEAPKEVLQLIGDKVKLINLKEPFELDTNQTFILFDSLPSVERTPKDNVWKQKS